MTRETVISDTPAARATSLIVGALLPRREVLMFITFTLPPFGRDTQWFEGRKMADARAGTLADRAARR
ncbi:hypothetical protein SP5_053_00120 [Sphingomonas parapaucimobilis NBRC 15100]|uniref:Uncharacterized protein n=1 Tax=Sphingomonas parapaucimobilis NBRC 15100 TaxID=1219049 RepID=A0A0A1W8G0_9SPHN|nr:hypothetical protein SP5_053_00120 [Sphingomonas parapaucimobilis NBRC 15100]